MTVLKSAMPEFKPGTVWLVGAGPGDPGLLTLLAAHALQSADVVVYDALVSDKVLALVRPQAELIFAGKRGGKPSASQPDITRQIIAQARAGCRVTRLKGGDPLIFGRGGEEALALGAAGIGFRIVPGITAGVGGLAYAGIPATHRSINSAVTFLTGHDARGLPPDGVDWQAIARGSPVIVLYMALKFLGEITGNLIKAGRAPDEPVALVANATLEDQHVVTTTLAYAARDASQAGIAPPAIVVVGKVVDLRRHLDWFAAGRGE
ncbi:MAG: uroporphyrinogen-III C-methyltransferase [Hyphomicrobiales bacterium]